MGALFRPNIRKVANPPKSAAHTKEKKMLPRVNLPLLATPLVSTIYPISLKAWKRVLHVCKLTNDDGGILLKEQVDTCV